jgi:N-acetyl-D-muramate 6-phosphate phosphatase
VAAAWGYLGAGEPIDAWGADHVIASPDQLLKLLAIG